MTGRGAGVVDFAFLLGRAEFGAKFLLLGAQFFTLGPPVLEQVQDSVEFRADVGGEDEYETQEIDQTQHDRRTEAAQRGREHVAVNPAADVAAEIVGKVVALEAMDLGREHRRQTGPADQADKEGADAGHPDLFRVSDRDVGQPEKTAGDEPRHDPEPGKANE